jgi:nucleolar protein 56
LKLLLLSTEVGLVLLDEKNIAVSKLEFSKSERARRFLDVNSGTLDDTSVEWLRENLKGEDVIFTDPQLVRFLGASGLRSEALSDDQLKEYTRTKIELVVSAGLVSTAEEAEQAIRDVSLEVSALKIKELSANPDLQAMESVQALDEIDKTANIMSARVREWYGLHFPELTSWIDENISLMKLILKFRTRENYSAEELEAMGYSKNKSRAIEEAARQSRGADIREEDLLRVAQLAEETLHLFSLRDKLATHVEKTMKQVAPNVSEIAGASIGARLIAKAGGLRKLAILPSSTIQILGAEKALYRALKSGARPPKHGILFQHEAVHSAPKWQRGKIARSVAGKIAIAARIDSFRGTRDENLGHSLKLRIDEIKEKYKEAPREKKEFIPQPRREFPRREGGGGRRSGGSKREDRRKGRYSEQQQQRDGRPRRNKPSHNQ